MLLKNNYSILFGHFTDCYPLTNRDKTFLIVYSLKTEGEGFSDSAKEVEAEACAYVLSGSAEFPTGESCVKERVDPE